MKENQYKRLLAALAQLVQTNEGQPGAAMVDDFLSGYTFDSGDWQAAKEAAAGKQPAHPPKRRIL